MELNYYDNTSFPICFIPCLEKVSRKVVVNLILMVIENDICT